jgi:hypothetical protein
LPPQTVRLMSTANAGDLASWLVAIGGDVHAGVQLSANVENGNRGVLAASACRQGQALMSVPPAGCLHVAADPLTAEHEVRISPQLQPLTGFSAQDARACGTDIYQ